MADKDSAEGDGTNHHQKKEADHFASEISNSIDSVITRGTKQQQNETSSTNEKNSDGTKTSKVTSSIETLSVKEMSDGEVMKLLMEKEKKKQQEKLMKYELKKNMIDTKESHKFWDSQPVPKLSEEIIEAGPIDANIDVSNVRQEPYNMPGGFEWCILDVADTAQLQEMYVLLTENYVEDDDSTFRFDYSMDFLRWALTPPGYFPELHIGVRNTKTGALMGCITAIPSDIRVGEEVRHMVEVNFLCVHKKLRTKRLAPVLIKEVTRRVNLHERWQAAYTAGVVLPKPVGRCRYYHRSLNPKKLIEVKFSSLPARTTLAALMKNLKLPDRPTRSFVPLQLADMPRVHELLTQSLTKAKLCQVFSLEELTHILTPRANVISCYVTHNAAGQVTDFCSFYHLPSTIFKCDKHSKLFAAYSYYNVATTMTFQELMADALVLAKLEGSDVFNALDLMNNSTVLTALKFGQGDGFLQYYLYNWRCPRLESAEVGLVLL